MRKVQPFVLKNHKGNKLCSWTRLAAAGWPGAAIDIYFTLARVYTSDNGSVAGPSRSTELHYHLGTQISLVCEVRHGPTHHSSVHWIFQVRVKYFRKKSSFMEQ